MPLIYFDYGQRQLHFEMKSWFNLVSHDKSLAVYLGAMTSLTGVYNETGYGYIEFVIAPFYQLSQVSYFATYAQFDLIDK